MRRQFSVDGLIYELEIASDNSVFVGLTGGASPAFQPEPDPFDWHAMPYLTDDTATSRYPLRVTRKVIALIYEWLGSERPNHFGFSASTERRLSLYSRVAKEIAKRFGYSWHQDHGRFFFYRER